MSLCQPTCAKMFNSSFVCLFQLKQAGTQNGSHILEHVLWSIQKNNFDLEVVWKCKVMPLVKSNRRIPVKNTLNWCAVVSFACELILFSVTSHLVTEWEFLFIILTQEPPMKTCLLKHNSMQQQTCFQPADGGPCPCCRGQSRSCDSSIETESFFTDVPLSCCCALTRLNKVDLYSPTHTSWSRVLVHSRLRGAHLHWHASNVCYAPRRPQKWLQTCGNGGKDATWLHAPAVTAPVCLLPGK
jgi:hypothetical protein